MDFERRCLDLPGRKTGKQQVVLNTHTLQILAGLERLPDNPHVIPGPKPGSHRATLQNTWTRVRREADIADVRIHDLRHTYASYGVNGGQSLAMVGKLLGHRKVQTTMRYTHLADDPLRQAAESIGAELTAGLEGAEAAEVVELTFANFDLARAKSRNPRELGGSLLTSKGGSLLKSAQAQTRGN